MADLRRATRTGIVDESSFRPASDWRGGSWVVSGIIEPLDRALRGHRVPKVDRPSEPCEVDYERAARELRSRRIRHRRRDRAAGCPPEFLGASS